MANERNITLLGQPNSGKSSVFNTLTGSHQHVGNWPGKTVEKVEGEFTHDGKKYFITDLPGTYSLSANSDEEIVTRDYIASGAADLVCILADSSQLERSLFMLADFAGIMTPAILVLTMTDVAKAQEKTIDTKKFSEKLGIPVVSLIAPEKKSYDDFFRTLEEALEDPKTLSADALDHLYKTGESHKAYEDALSLVPEDDADGYSRTWLAAKLLEGDSVVARKIARESDQAAVDAFLEDNPDGSLYTSDCKFAWIETLLSDVVTKPQSSAKLLSKFDRLAISPRWGKAMAVGILVLGILLSMAVASPFMTLGEKIPSLLYPLIEKSGMSPVLASFVNGTIVTALGWVLAMAGFVFGIHLVFGLIEEVGYMARVSYVFDNTMNKLGLQGKSIMPMLVSFGCTIGGAAGARVIDSYGQRVLTIALAWAVPCGATFAVIPTLSSAIFGTKGAMLVMLLIFAIMFVHIIVTAKIFGRSLSPVEERTGLIMELPPYHRPRWGSLLRSTAVQAWGVFKKAFVVVVVVAAVFWGLSYSASGDVTGSVLYRFGRTIEPVTKFFGMGWQTFLAFLSSMISKEAVLGVTGVLFGGGSASLWDATASGAADARIGALIAASISKPEALAFIIAVTFNVPCIMAINATLEETHSTKWTLRIALYYMVSALVLACLTYHIAGLFY